MNTKLDMLRGQIDIIDNTIVDLLSERHNIVKKIAVVKKSAVADPSREKEIIKRLKKDARKNGLDEVFVEELYSLIFAQSRKTQENILNK